MTFFGSTPVFEVSLLLGFIVVSPFDSVSSYLIPGQVSALILVSPLVRFFGLWESPIFYLTPTHGALLLLGGAFETAQLSVWELSYAVLYQLLWVGGLALLTRRAFDRYIVARKGR
jgi:fluoroquinolone transport system permease protein